MNYVILKGNKTDDLMREVNKYVQMGWKCAGGLCIGQRVGDIFYQAMSKEYEEPELPPYPEH